MATPLRADFSQASVGLTLPAQRRNLRALHDWLVDEQQMPDDERVIALTNYQQGRFGRMPSHILLVTARRIAFTSDKGLRSIPMAEVEPSRIGVKIGMVNGEVTLVLRDGELLTFRRGMALGMQQVVAALQQQLLPGNSSGRSDPTGRSSRGQGSADQPSGPVTGDGDAALAASNEEGWPPRAERTLRGSGDDILEFQQPVASPTVLQISGGGRSSFAVWALDENLQQADLLVNTTDRYSGVRVIGNGGAVRALQMEATGSWSVVLLSPEELPVLQASCAGVGDAVVFMQEDLGPTETGLVASVRIQGEGAAALWAFGSSTDLLVNQIAPYAGRVVIPSGTQYLVVDAAGPWEVRT